jgi:NADPH2:quinone reductase
MLETMRAAIVVAPEAPFQTMDMPRPEAGPGQVLVRILASGTNPLDTKIHAGTAAHARHPLPAILGMDLAGVVVAVGAGVSRFKVDDEVFGMTGGVGGVQGTLAQYAAVDADLLAHKPARLSMRQVAAMPLLVITAWQGLVDRMAIAAGQTVLIQGGAGGVGHIAIQIAVAFGATVFATGSVQQRGIIEQYGATSIDRDEAVADYVGRLTGELGFDCVYDTAGGIALDASFSAVRRYGHVASCLGWGTHALAPLSFKGASYSGVFTLLPLLSGQGGRRHGEILEAASKLADDGLLAPRLNPTHYGFADLDNAYRLVREGSVMGKIVIEP